MNGSVEHPVVAKFLRQGGGLPKNATEPAPDILSVEQGFGVFGQDFLHRMKRTIHHEGRFVIVANSLTFFLLDVRWGKRMCQEIFRCWLRLQERLVKLFLNFFSCFALDAVQFVFVNSQGYQSLSQTRNGIAFFVCFKIIAVPFLAHSTGVMPEQWNMGMHHHGFSVFTDVIKSRLHGLHAHFRIGTIDFKGFDLGEGLDQRAHIVGSNFRSMRRNVPFVVLHQPNDRQLLQITHVKGLAYFPFRHGCVSNGANHHRCFSLTVVCQTTCLAVLHAHGNSCGRNGLHACCAALMGNPRKSWPVERRMAVIRSASRKRVVSLG